jgi:centromeric protein E
MNHQSSRSHTLFRLHVESVTTNSSEGTNVIKESVLNFVDLAGSEKVSNHSSGTGPGTSSLNQEYGGGSIYG